MPIRSSPHRTTSVGTDVPGRPAKPGVPPGAPDPERLRQVVRRPLPEGFDPTIHRDRIDAWRRSGQGPRASTPADYDRLRRSLLAAPPKP